MLIDTKRRLIKGWDFKGVIKALTASLSTRPSPFCITLLMIHQTFSLAHDWSKRDCIRISERYFQISCVSVNICREKCTCSSSHLTFKMRSNICPRSSRFLKLCSLKTVRFSDKADIRGQYPSIFLRQMLLSQRLL